MFFKAANRILPRRSFVTFSIDKQKANDWFHNIKNKVDYNLRYKKSDLAFAVYLYGIPISSYWILPWTYGNIDVDGKTERLFFGTMFGIVLSIVWPFAGMAMRKHRF
jgi:hypothetical protein